MNAYRYLASHWIDTLRDKRFKLAKPSELNDPFDCVGVYKGNPPRLVAKSFARRLVFLPAVQAQLALMPRNKRRETINKQTKAARVHYQTNIAQLSTSLAQSKRALDKNTRILSMSLADLSDASPDERASILMWSHYAKHHSGVRIGLDLAILTGANCFVRPVLYSDERPTHDWSVSANIEHKEFVQTVIQTKSRAWSYEKEIRLFVLPNYCTADSLADGTPASFLVFEPAAILRVDFGLLMPQDQQNECLAVLSAAYPHVTVFSAKYHPTQYALDYEQIR